MKSLEKEDQLDLFWAICNYGIYGAEPQGLSTLAGAFFTLMQPSLEAAPALPVVHPAVPPRETRMRGRKSRQNNRRRTQKTTKQPLKNNLLIWKNNRKTTPLLRLRKQQLLQRLLQEI